MAMLNDQRVNIYTLVWAVWVKTEAANMACGAPPMLLGSPPSGAFGGGAP
jgi:hypothetical protein